MKQHILKVTGLMTLVLAGMLCTFTLSADQIQQDGDTVYKVVDGMPRYPGGDAEMMKYIARNTVYPEAAQAAGEEGRVVLSYTIEKDGSLTDIHVVRSISESLDKEAIRLVKEMPKWQAGTNKGEIVRVRYTLPIIFRLQ